MTDGPRSAACVRDARIISPGIARPFRVTLARGLSLVMLFVLACIAISAWAGPEPADRAGSPAGSVVQFDINGPIGPATSDFAVRVLEHAEEQHAQLVVIRMDTPGGLDTAMRAIIKKILVSSVPVAGFVAPSGARAASAGTYILYACHLAAMAPGTNVGAATPIRIGGLGLGEEPDAKDKKEGAKSASPADTLSRKMVNDAVAYLRGLAALRGRNADWAEKAVREAASLPADEALKLKVIDLMAADVPELLHKLEGRRIKTPGREITLQLAGTTLELVEPDWRSRVLAIITEPNVAYILMLVGMWGLILEFSHPGAVAPGTVGAICLLLALYAFQVLPVNYAGLGLLLLGIALMVAEAFVPSFGVLGIGGGVAFVIGSVMLMETTPGFGIDPGLIAAFALCSLLFFVFVLGFVVRARRQPVVTGGHELVGTAGVALEDFAGLGKIRIQGEIWNARSLVLVRKGENVRVKKMDGLTLWVEPSATPESEP